MSEEARKRARETLARLAARDADRELMMVEPEVDTPAEDEPTLTEQRRAYKQAAKAGGIEARLWANLESWKRARFDGLWKAFDAFKGAVMKAVADKVVGEIAGMKAAVNEHQVNAFEELQSEIRRELLKRSTESPADRDRAARKAAERAATIIRGELRGDIVRLTRELEATRTELEALKQERGLRAIK